MYCKNCGVKLREGAKFCNECGTKVDVETTTKTSKSNENNTNTTSTLATTTTSNNVVMPINKSKATASLVLGILSFIVGVLFFPLPIIGLVLGICQKEKCGEKTAGIILNAIALGLTVITWFFVIIFIIVGVVTNEDEYSYRDDNYGYSDEIIEDDYHHYKDIYDY